MKHSIVVGSGPVGVFMAQVLAQKFPVQMLIRRDNAAEYRPPPITGAKSIDNSRNISVEHYQAIDKLPPGATIFVCTKAHQLRQVLSSLAPKMKDDHTLVLCQNGLGIIESVHDLLTDKIQQCVRMMCLFGVRFNEKKECVLAGGYSATLGGAPLVVNSVNELLIEAGFGIRIGSSIAEIEWEKSLLNLVTNSIATLVDERNGIVVDDPNLHQLARLVLEEARSVMHADGIVLPELTADEVFRRISTTSLNFNSHLMDIRQARASDMEFLFGEFLKRATAYGISTPRIDTIWSLLRYMSSKRCSA